MNVNITSRSQPLSDQIKDFIQEKLTTLEEYLPDDSLSHIILSRVRYLEMVELIIKTDGTVITARASDSDQRQSIEEAVNRARRQWEKHKGKKQDRGKGLGR